MALDSTPEKAVRRTRMGQIRTFRTWGRVGVGAGLKRPEMLSGERKGAKFAFSGLSNAKYIYFALITLRFRREGQKNGGHEGPR